MAVVLTLFGEEIIPEQMNAVGRPARPKKAKATPVPVEEALEPEATQDAIADDAPTTPTYIEATTDTPAETTTEKPTAKKVGRPKAAIAKVPQDTSGLLEGWTGDKQYYTIGEVAALFKVATSHIRFWTNEFELKVRTTRKGDRLYTPEQIREIRGIYYLVKEKRYTISGAKAKLKEKTVSVDSIDLKRSLLHLRNKLLTIRNQLA